MDNKHKKALTELTEWRLAHDLAPSTFGQKFAGDSTFLNRLARGGVRASTLGKVRNRMRFFEEEKKAEAKG